MEFILLGLVPVVVFCLRKEISEINKEFYRKLSRMKLEFLLSQ